MHNYKPLKDSKQMSLYLVENKLGDEGGVKRDYY